MKGDKKMIEAKLRQDELLTAQTQAIGEVCYMKFRQLLAKHWSDFGDKEGKNKDFPRQMFEAFLNEVNKIEIKELNGIKSELIEKK